MDDRDSGVRRALTFTHEDVAAMIRLLGDAIAADEPLEVTRTRLFGSLSSLLGADIWMWMQSRTDSASGSIAPLSIVDDGWRDEAERNAFVNANWDPALNALLLPNILVHEHRTGRTRELFPATVDTADVLRAWSERTGMGDCILSSYALGDKMWSVIGFHRRLDKPAFSVRDRSIAHVMLTQVDFLHRHGTEAPAAGNDRLLGLTPRQKEVIVHLLGGDSAKQIAGRMGLSLHTVNDYIRTIYRTLDVSSRPELMQQFLAGKR